MTKKVERDFWGAFITSNGFFIPEEEPEPSFNLTIFHRKSLKFDLGPN